MRFVECGDRFGSVELIDDFVEISRQGALPAQGVDAVGKRRRHQLVETVHQLDTHDREDRKLKLTPALSDRLKTRREIRSRFSSGWREVLLGSAWPYLRVPYPDHRQRRSPR